MTATDFGIILFAATATKSKIEAFSKQVLNPNAVALKLIQNKSANILCIYVITRPSNHITYSIIDRFVFLSPIKILIKNMIQCIIFFKSLHSYKEFIYLCVVATVSERKKMEIDFKMSKNRFVISLQNLGWGIKKIDP